MTRPQLDEGLFSRGLSELLYMKVLSLLSLLLLTAALPLRVFASQHLRQYGQQGATSVLFPALPDTTENIHLGLVFNYKITDPQTEAGKVDFVWASQYPTQPAQVYNTYYYPYDREPDGGHDINWFLQNHPDWIEYQCDKTTIAYEFGAPNPPLDITNPAVLSYIETTYLAPNLQLGTGYQGIAFDNPSFGNDGAWTGMRCGHFDTSGNWVAQFNATSDDPAYRQAIIQWAQSMRSWIHTHFPAATMGVNFSYAFGFPSDSDTLLSNIDIDCDESGFTNGNNGPPWFYTDEQWLAKMQSLQRFLSPGHELFSINQEPIPFTELTDDQVQWALANYLLIKNNASYLNISGYQEFGDIYIRPEYAAPIGHATNSMYLSQQVYMRDFSNGLSIVNPSSSQAITISLPANTYKDLYGNTINPPITLPIHTGLVLLKSN
jgi:hypothetical protein